MSCKCYSNSTVCKKLFQAQILKKAQTTRLMDLVNHRWGKGFSLRHPTEMVNGIKEGPHSVLNIPCLVNKP